MNFSADYFKSQIRTIRDWPRPGVNFRDVTTLFQNPEVFRRAVDILAANRNAASADVIAAVDARGFVLGSALAYRMGKPLALVRKKGKLPWKTVSQSFEMEYGYSTLEIHTDACQRGNRILLTDDLLASGGTLAAASRLFNDLGGVVIGVSVLIDLVELGGTARLREMGIPVHALCSFTEDEPFQQVP